MTADDAEIRARAAWSLVAEPGDAAAVAVVAALGAPEALRWATWAVGVRPDEAERALRARVREHGSPGRVPAAVAATPPADAAAPGDPAPGDRHTLPLDLAPPPDPGTGSGADVAVPGVRVRGSSAPTPLPASAGSVARAPDAALRVLARALPRWAPRLAVLDPGRALDALHRQDGMLLVPGSADWPSGLDDLGPTRPLCLWVRGRAALAALAQRSVAVVGARAATPYGQHVATDLGADLAATGVTVLSGGAFGIDVAAHRGALRVGGPSVALLAGGVDRPSPEANRHVLEALLDAGALVAESPPGSVPSRARFLQRNRLIAALGSVTVVVEAAARSGALSTATHAADLLRPLGAVPGPVTSMASVGCHRLLRSGAAVCVTSTDDVLELLGTASGGPPDAADPEGEGRPEPTSTRPATSAPVSHDSAASQPGSPPSTVAGAGLPGPAGSPGSPRATASRSVSPRSTASGPVSRGPAGPSTASRSSAAAPPSLRPTLAAGTPSTISPPADPTASRPEQAGGRPAARGARSRRHPAESVAGRVLDALAARRGRDAAEVARRSGLSVREVVSALGALELAGEACRVEGGWRRP